MVVLLLLAGSPAGAQQDDLGATLPLDTSIRTGQLPNGFTYFIRQNDRPEKRASLRLAVMAGSIDEAEHERGLAHFLEHMGFNGGRHFQPGELVKYLESIGSSFGAHLNAYTSFDETVYMVEVPTDREGLLERGLDAMYDFAGGMLLLPDEIDRERGVVIEERRMRRDVGTRVIEQQANVMFGDSKYADRLPIGLPEVVTGASPDTVRGFYERWYRPDRMALIAVGDVDPAALEPLIVKEFSALEKPATPPPPRDYPIPDHEGTQYSVATDPEVPQSTVSIMERRPMGRQDRVGDYRRSLVERLAVQMLNERLAQIARQPDAPFLGASAGQSLLSQDVIASMLRASVKDGGIEAGLTAIAQEAARASRHGFSAAELDRARRRLLASYERMYNERDTSESGGLASELVRHFLTNEPVPGMAGEFDLARRFVPAITAEETTEVARRFWSGENRVVLAVAPDKDGLAAPTEAGLRETLERALAAELDPWPEEDDTPEQLMSSLPVPGTVTDDRVVSELGATVLRLSNGVEVWLKPTDFKADQVVFTAYAKGGLSLAAPDEYHEADLATNLADVSGAGGFSPIDLEKLLAGRTAGASPFIGTYTHGISGSSSAADLETALQLVHLYMTAPNWNDESFTLLKTRLQAALANRAQNPTAAFSDAVEAVNRMGHYSSVPLTADKVPTLRADVMQRFYEARFANAADFTFIFAGSFNVNNATSLAARYLGSLPSTGIRTAEVGDVRFEFPPDVRREAVRKGKEPKAQTMISLFADTGLDEMEMHRLRAAISVLDIRLNEVLREQMGGTYSVGVGYRDSQPVPGWGMVQVVFGSAPDNVAELTAAVMKEVAALKAEGPTGEDVAKVKEIEKRQLETSASNNGYWMGSIQTVLTLGWDPTSIVRRPQRTESLTRENIQAAFRKYFPEDRYTVVSLLPEQ